ncbi:hypothetical protein MMC29_003732 [Sticta canariensis]|nr:hypothetical protein [Sticta canariensis]
MKAWAIYHKISKTKFEKGADVDNFPLVLIGNKCDYAAVREVSTAEGIALTQEFCCEFTETSAKLALRIAEPFFKIVRAQRSRQVPQIVEIDDLPQRESKAIYQGPYQFLRRVFRCQKYQTSVHSPSIEDSSTRNQKAVKFSGNPDRQGVRKQFNCRMNKVEQSAFYAAAATGHSKAVKMLFTKGVNLSVKEPGYMRPLQIAALEGHADVVRLLLEEGAPVNEKTRLYGTALICASSRGNISVVRILIDHGADVNAKGGRYGNALHAAAALGKVDLARLLLDSGANVEATGNGGFTALQVAAFPGRFDMIELLLSRGALLDLQLPIPSPVTSPYSAQDDASSNDVISHFDYGASEVVRASAQVIVDLVHHGMFGAAKKIKEQETSK